MANLGAVHPRWGYAFGACLLGALVLALMPAGIPMPSTGWDKSNHLLCFAVLALLGCRAYAGRETAVLLGLLFYGGAIEVLQSFTSYRSAEWRDLLADAAGLALGLGLRALGRKIVSLGQGSGFSGCPKARQSAKS